MLNYIDFQKSLYKTILSEIILNTVTMDIFEYWWCNLNLSLLGVCRWRSRPYGLFEWLLIIEIRSRIYRTVLTSEYILCASYFLNLGFSLWRIFIYQSPSFICLFANLWSTTSKPISLEFIFFVAIELLMNGNWFAGPDEHCASSIRVGVFAGGTEFRKENEKKEKQFT